jgi:hypothetical protein
MIINRGIATKITYYTRRDYHWVKINGVVASFSKHSIWLYSQDREKALSYFDGITQEVRPRCAAYEGEIPFEPWRGEVYHPEIGRTMKVIAIRSIDSFYIRCDRGRDIPLHREPELYDKLRDTLEACQNIRRMLCE